MRFSVNKFIIIVILGGWVLTEFSLFYQPYRLTLFYYCTSVLYYYDMWLHCNSLFSHLLFIIFWEGRTEQRPQVICTENWVKFERVVFLQLPKRRDRQTDSRTGRNISVVFDSGLFLHYIKTWRHPLNRKYITYHTVDRERLSHGHKRWVQKIWWNLDTVFDIFKRTGRKTNTDTMITVLRNPTIRYGRLTCARKLTRWTA